MSKTLGESLDIIVDGLHKRTIYKVEPTTNTGPDWTCPRCDKVSGVPPALCRRDNKTEICSDCGRDQAMEDFAARSNPKEDRHI